MDRRWEHKNEQKYKDEGKSRQENDIVITECQKKLSDCKDLKNLPADTIVDISNKVGKYLKENGLKMNQVRKFLDGVRRLDIQFDRGKSFNPDGIILLKPKLAYAAGREKAVKPLLNVLEPAIDASKSSYESFKKLVALIEGILAYHKFYGGGD